MPVVESRARHVVDVELEARLRIAAEQIRQAEAILVCAGAGMGVDSGLPDFRGPQGFWRAYPRYRHLGLQFEDMANAAWFRRDPTMAWGFYGHRRNLYRATQPHRGFEILLRWAEAAPAGYFVFTSNVDGQFQKAGFSPDRIVECHGSIEIEQCWGHCGVGTFMAQPSSVDIDERRMRAADPLPSCPACGGLARPNILMFGDMLWDWTRADEQHETAARWLEEVRGARLVVIECGAGVHIATVRMIAESYGARPNGLVRINPRDAEVPEGGVGLAGGALEVLTELDGACGERPLDDERTARRGPLCAQDLTRS